MSGPLKNPRHEAFCQEYSQHGNGGKAYRAAGYRASTDASAHTCAHKLLRKGEIRARADDLMREISERGVKLLISERDQRVRCLQDFHDKLVTVVKERAEAVEMAGAPGGKTGLLCRRLKMIGSGKDAEIVEEFEVDTATLKEIRAHMDQAAIELGQRVEIHQVDVQTSTVIERLTARRKRLNATA